MARSLLSSLIAALTVAALAAPTAPAQDKKPDAPKPAVEPKSSENKDDQKPAGDLAPIDLKLPKPAFKGTPKNVPPGTNLEKPRTGPRPPFEAPKGAKNLAAGKPVTASDSDPITGKLAMITDGDKEATEGSYVELGPGLQWVQIDLKEPSKIYAVVAWRYHMNARVYHDVVVQVSDDKDFLKGVKTIFNNDHDNSSGLGVGDAKEFWETYEGHLVDGKGAVGRYVRLYTKGNTADDQNHYVEVEVWGAK